MTGGRRLLVLALALALAGCIQQGPGSVQDGTILAAAPVNQPGENSGAGAVAGAVVGGVAGSFVGSGGAQAAAIILGAAAGEVAGSQAEAAAQHHTGVAYTLRLSDGQVMTVAQHLQDGQVPLAVGANVRLVTNGEVQSVVAE